MKQMVGEVHDEDEIVTQVGGFLLGLLFFLFGLYELIQLINETIILWIDFTSVRVAWPCPDSKV